MSHYEYGSLADGKRDVLFNVLAGSSVIEALSIKPLEILYKEGLRYYHTYEHARQVASAAVRLAYLTIQDFSDGKNEALYLAGMWHDAIYVHGSPDNEKLSAAKFSEYYDIPMTSYLINKTTLANHLTEETGEAYLDCLLDADILSLARPYSVFFENNDNLIKESGVTEVTNEHRLKSAEFLNNFLNKKSIYRTDMCKRNYEHIARKNIEQYQKEMQCLV